MRGLLPILILALAAGPAAGRQTAPSETRRLQAEYRDEAVRARRLRAEASAAGREIAALEDQLRRLRAQAEGGDLRVQAQRQRLEELTGREAALLARMTDERARQGRMLTALQMMSRRPPPPLLIPADQAVDTTRAAILLRAMTPQIEARVRALRARQDEIARVRRLAVLSSEALITLESEQGDRLAEIETLTARRRALATVLKAEAAAAARAAAVLEARIRALGGDVSVPETTDPVPTGLPGGLTRLAPPLAGEPSQRFGGGSVGWRWRADRRQAAAPASGRVLHAGPLKGWGQVVILDLGPGWRAVVAGLDALEVSAGADVRQGQTLGRSAQDGEIYFELRRDERPVDPAPWLG
ncbi:MAG: peptidoglycan DD-metalloendopeptidase family protein [Brevundimonas sp.]|uniref:murein hydrolase activator EnvC family protein n=1 Tax=Brevundimonas sp. TaxID=1871086 RepID=UPI0025C4AC85|nr:peptidoglycan DD-metalloendopeptidase family protein [Brevundimonas sp.]MBX3476962.1 peptidoglycan DD-metalloendopeptidase family protein [Brevundimonas sp.]